MLETVTRLLELGGQTMRVRDVHTAASELLGRRLHRSSVKGVLSAHTLGGDRRFRRVRRGVYELAMQPAGVVERFTAIATGLQPRAPA